MVLYIAGDIGGTNSRLQLFEILDQREILLVENTYPSQKYSSMTHILREFINTYRKQLQHIHDKNVHQLKIAACCLAVAGPVSNDVAKLTNVQWTINGRELERDLSIGKVVIINDFAGIGYGLLGLKEYDYFQLNPGVKPNPTGPKACLGAGTGLGECYLTHNGKEYDVWSCEGGHTDFPARDEVEFDIMMHIKSTQNLHRVSIERVVSGMGLTNIFDYLSSKQADKVAEHVKKAIEAGMDKNRVITDNALNKSCPVAVQTLNLWISLYGAEAGNLALKTLPTGGLYVAGGIAAKVMWAVFEDNSFYNGFKDKGRMEKLLVNIPIYFVNVPQIGLLGSRVMCRRLVRDLKIKQQAENYEQMRIHSRM